MFLLQRSGTLETELPQIPGSKEARGGKRGNVDCGGQQPALNDEPRPIPVAVHQGIPMMACDGLYLYGNLYETHVTCLVDTGATIFIIRESIYHQIAVQDRPDVVPARLKMVLCGWKQCASLGHSCDRFACW